MKPTRTGLLLLLLLVLLGAPALVAAFTPPGPPPLWHQNAMRMSYREELLSPPTERELEALERRLAPSAAAWLRLASAVVMGGAYLASPVMGTTWSVTGLLSINFLRRLTIRIHLSIHPQTNSPAPRRGRHEHDGAGRERHGVHVPRYVIAAIHWSIGRSMMSIDIDRITQPPTHPKGFGCGSYQGQDFNGAARPSDEPSIDMQV